MPVELRTISRAGARTGAGRMLPLAALLGVVVVLAAGIGGTANFTGPRWYPHLGGSVHTTPPIIKQKLPSAPPLQAVHRHHATLNAPLWLALLVIGLLALGLAAVLYWLWSKRRAPAAPGLHAAAVQGAQRPVPPEPEPEPEPAALLTGIELALQILDERREPGDAIVRAWIGLQETAAESGIVRRPAESPTEFTARILAGAFADDAALRTLLALYLRTRFGDHPASADDVTAVRAALRQLVSSWHTPERASAGAR